MYILKILSLHMDKYQESNKISKKKYNSDKTFVQISKELHKNVKDHCEKNGLKVKDFLEDVIKNSL
jgi:hypothetical protein